MKVLFVCSCGGHFDEAISYVESVEEIEVVFVLNQRIEIPANFGYDVRFISHSARDIKFILNLYELCNLIIQIKPTIVISTGASPGFWAILLSRFFRIDSCYIESVTRVNELSLTGKLVQFLASRCYSPHSTICKKYILYKKIVGPI